MQHQDNHGKRGDLTPGSVQWMTAGRGILHSEMPQQENGLMWGFPLWVNLPAKDKLTAPRYQDRSEAHTSELQSLMRISYAAFCLKKTTMHTTRRAFPLT